MCSNAKIRSALCTRVQSSLVVSLPDEASFPFPAGRCRGDVVLEKSITGYSDPDPIELGVPEVRSTVPPSRGRDCSRLSCNSPPTYRCPQCDPTLGVNPQSCPQLSTRQTASVNIFWPGCRAAMRTVQQLPFRSPSRSPSSHFSPSSYPLLHPLKSSNLVMVSAWRRHFQEFIERTNDLSKSRDLSPPSQAATQMSP